MSWKTDFIPKAAILYRPKNTAKYSYYMSGRRLWHNKEQRKKAYVPHDFISLIGVGLLFDCQ